MSNVASAVVKFAATDPALFLWILVSAIVFLLKNPRLIGFMDARLPRTAALVHSLAAVFPDLRALRDAVAPAIRSPGARSVATGVAAGASLLLVSCWPAPRDSGVCEAPNVKAAILLTRDVAKAATVLCSGSREKVCREDLPAATAALDALDATLEQVCDAATIAGIVCGDQCGLSVQTAKGLACQK